MRKTKRERKETGKRKDWESQCQIICLSAFFGHLPWKSSSAAASFTKHWFCILALPSASSSQRHVCRQPLIIYGEIASRSRIVIFCEVQHWLTLLPHKNNALPQQLLLKPWSWCPPPPRVPPPPSNHWTLLEPSPSARVLLHQNDHPRTTSPCCLHSTILPYQPSTFKNSIRMLFQQQQQLQHASHWSLVQGSDSNQKNSVDQSKFVEMSNIIAPPPTTTILPILSTWPRKWRQEVPIIGLVPWRSNLVEDVVVHQFLHLLLEKEREGGLMMYYIYSI